MKKFMKKIILLLLFLSILLNLTGCYDASGIEELAYVVAIGLDLNENDEFELSVQIATSDDKSSDKSSNSTSQSSNSNVTTIKCNSINSRIFINQ
ncbi:MAG: hypothetical protein IJH12_00355 [Clostridia bacterium]|nr:hypothetical protein [Clostridia bacterium]